mmetsp:Transcript_5273/g.7369  ORF Transcript_5273/g.7369 Transcript_5273/m.7369 type:complete len:105 (+) Transcript_5273:947-1261(+)
MLDVPSASRIRSLRLKIDFAVLLKNLALFAAFMILEMALVNLSSSSPLRSSKRSSRTKNISNKPASIAKEKRLSSRYPVLHVSQVLGDDATMCKHTSTMFEASE